MFLSKIHFDRRRWDVVRDIEDRDRLHKKIGKLFPDYPGGGRNNFRELMGILFRVEEKFLILQSKLAPDQRRLSPGYTIEGTKDVTLNYASIREGIVYRFRLDANTSRQVRLDDGEWIPHVDGSIQTMVQTRRIACKSFDERRHWLEMRMAKSGIYLLDFAMDSLPIVRANEGVFEVTRFEGRMKIKRLDAFIHALHEGIGQGKAYGLGLLSLCNA